MASLMPGVARGYVTALVEAIREEGLREGFLVLPEKICMCCETLALVQVCWKAPEGSPYPYESVDLYKVWKTDERVHATIYQTFGPGEWVDVKSFLYYAPSKEVVLIFTRVSFTRETFSLPPAITTSGK